MSKPTYRALCYVGAGIKHSQNLPTGHCVTVVQNVYAVSIPTCRALCYIGAGIKHSQNLPAGHCVAGAQTVLAMSESTGLALCYSGADCLSSVRTYLPGTVLQW